MASIRAAVLNRRLRDLEKSLNQAAQEHQNQMNRIQGEYDRQLQELRLGQDQALARLRTEMTDECRRLADEAIERVNQATTARLNALREENERHRRQCDDIMRQIQAEHEQYNKKLDAYLERQSEEIQEKQRFASQTLAEAEKQAEALSAEPFRHFFGDEFEEYHRLLEDARTNFRNRLYEAASAAASMARALMNGLFARLNVKLREWDQYFEVFSTLTASADEQFRSLIQSEQTSVFGGRVWSLAEWNFWSEGQIQPLEQTLREASELVRHVNEVGSRAYLREEGALSRDALYERTGAAYQFAHRITSSCGKAMAEARLSDAREHWAEQIREQLEREYNYRPLPGEAGRYAQPDPVTARAEWFRAFWDEIAQETQQPIRDYETEVTNPLQYYEMTMTYLGGDRLRIRLVPERLDGIAVQNVCMVDLDFLGACDSSTRRALLQENRARIQAMLSQEKEPLLRPIVLEAPPRSASPDRLIADTSALQKGKFRQTKKQPLV